MSEDSPPRGRRRPGRHAVLLSAWVSLAAGIVGVTSYASATDEVEVLTSSFTHANGRIFTVTNHLVQEDEQVTEANRALVRSALDGTNPAANRIVTSAGKIRHEYLLVWDGDWNAGDNNTANLSKSSPT